MQYRAKIVASRIIYIISRAACMCDIGRNRNIAAALPAARGVVYGAVATVKAACNIIMGAGERDSSESIRRKSVMRNNHHMLEITRNLRNKRKGVRACDAAHRLNSSSTRLREPVRAIGQRFCASRKCEISIIAKNIK